MRESAIRPAPVVGVVGQSATATLIGKILAGEMRSVSRCISLIENEAAEAAEILDAMHPHAGKATIIGVTGVPGAGKSTLVPALARRLVGRGSRPAILAVDPSSPLTGGAILGDRIRDSASAQLGLLFRSVASRGSLGGLSRTLDDVVTMLDAAGFDNILIETVGTGQSEIAVTRLAHTTLAVTAPGLGDEVQAMKAGILEVADLVVVNKADADPGGAEATADTIRTVLALSQNAHGLREGVNGAAGEESEKWLAPVRAVSALGGLGLDELISLITAHRGFLDRTGLAKERLAQRRFSRFRDALRDALLAHVTRAHAAELAALESEIARGHRNPISAARQLARLVIDANSMPVGPTRGAARS
jgi:LAO/AO transport system kinase